MLWAELRGKQVATISEWLASLGMSEYAERFADADGRIRATFDIIWLSGWAPHASQQQPLKPGSAKASLAEAVKKAGRT